MSQRPAKSEFRKTRSRNDTAASGDMQPADGTVRRRRGPRLLLPLVVLVVGAAYFDHSGTFSFWPAGALSSRLMPMLPPSMQAAARRVDAFLSPAKQADGEDLPPGGPGRPGPGAGSSSRRPGGGAPIPVLAAAVTVENVPVTASAVGTVLALATVTVRTQVDGQLLELAFKDGQMVKKGDVLARIDARTYQAQYDQAVAKKAQDESVLANARTDLARYEKLATTDYGTRQQADTQKALVAQDEAVVRSDQGAIDSARAALENCTIRAPLDGRTGIRTVDQGNIVHASDTSGIVVITQIQPISVTFNLPQQGLRAILSAMAAAPVAVDALEADDVTVLDRGHVEVIDNQVDQTTGTIKLRATFPNAQNQLWPGQFVNVRVLMDTLKGAVVVPSGAVQRGPAGAYVFVIGQDGTVKQSPVTIARQDETRAVIASGTVPGDRVVTTGFTRLVDGSKVTVGSSEAPTADPAAAAKRRQQKPGQTQTDAAKPDQAGTDHTAAAPGAAPADAPVRTGRKNRPADPAAAPAVPPTAPAGSTP